MSLVLFSTSCKKDDNDSEEKFSLKGKTYATYAYKGGGQVILNYEIPTYDAYRVFRFISDNEFEDCSRENSPIGGKLIGDIDTATYELDYPNIKFIFKNSNKDMEGSFIDENTFRCKGRGYEFILQK